MQPNTYTQAGKNVLRTWVFMTVFLVLVILLGYFIAYIYQSPGILYFAVLFAIGMNIFSYWYSDKIVLKLHHAVPVTRESNFELWNVVENLSITAGLPMPKIYIIDDPSPNAFATGRNKNHAVVCVTNGLLSLLNKAELEGVIAHELSHIGNRDILLSTVVVVLAGFVSILSHIFLRSSAWGGMRRSNDREGNAGAIFMLIGIVLAILAPIIAVLIQLAISRKREYLADAYGVLLTRYPEGLASALRKIGAYGQPLATANNADAHLFISNPFGPGKTRSFIANLFQTHPPIDDRIKALVGNESI